MILRNNNVLCGTPIYPWSIRTFLEFAAAEGTLLDLVIPGRSRNGGGEDVSRLLRKFDHPKFHVMQATECDEKVAMIF